MVTHAMFNILASLASFQSLKHFDWYNLPIKRYVQNRSSIINWALGRFQIQLIQNYLKYKFVVVYKIGITAGLTSIHEVAALFSPTRITYKDSYLSDNAVL